MKNPFKSSLFPSIFVIFCVASIYAGPMNFGNQPGPMNGDEPGITEQKILSATLAQPGTTATASAQIVVGTTPTSVPARFGRRGLTIRNIDQTATIFEGGDTSVSSTTGFPILPGESLPLDTQAAVYVVASAGSPRLAYVETFSPAPAPTPTPSP